MSETVNVRAGETFDLTLEAQPSAGYTWELASGDSSIVELIGSEWVPAGEIAGAPAARVFHFRALAPGTAVVRLTYGRSWEPAPIHERSFTVTVTACGAGKGA